MTVRVAPTEQQPTHHISLTDGNTTLGLIAVDSIMLPKVSAIKRSPNPRSTLRVNQGNGALSEQQAPYGEFSRETFIGGMGGEEGEADSTKYWFGKNVWTLADGRAMLGPKTLGVPALGSLSNTGTSDATLTLTTNINSVEWKGTLTSKANSLAIRAKGTATLVLRVYADSGGSRGALTYLCTATLNSAGAFVDVAFTVDIPAGTWWFMVRSATATTWYIEQKTNGTFPANSVTGTEAALVKTSEAGSPSGGAGGYWSRTFTVTGEPDWGYVANPPDMGGLPPGKLELLAGSTVVVTSNFSASLVDNYLDNLAGGAGTYTVKATFNSSYAISEAGGGGLGLYQITYTTASTTPPIFTATYTAESGGVQGEYFEYLGGLYYVTRPKTGASKLFKNCDRGAADSNTGALTTLVDGTKTGGSAWTTNIYAGAIAKITGGPGMGEWRKIVSNTGDTLTVSPAWDTTHTTSTEYVIIGLNLWTEITSTGFSATYPVQDVCVSNNNIVYCAQGQGAVIRRMREYNNSGTWTREFDDDTSNYADLLAFDWDQGATGGTPQGIIWRASNVTPPTVSSAPSIAWGTADLVFGTAIPIGDGSPIKGLIAYDGKVAVTKNNSVWMVKNNLPEKMSIDMGSQYEEFTGANPAVYTPYLIFPFGNGIERLYGQIVEDFTPDMPVAYSGQFVDSVSIPGALIAARRGVVISGTANQSMVLIWRNGAWHPFYAIDSTYQVFDVYYQRIDSGDDILWFAATTGILGIRFPREWDYLKDPAFTESGYEVSSEGYLVSGWYNAGSKRLDKWWESIFLSMDTVGSGTGASIAVYYQTRRYQSDTDISAWTYAGALSASGEINLRVLSKEIRFRFVLTGNTTQVPILLGYNCEYLARIDAADVYSVPVKLSDEAFDLQGGAESLSGAARLAILDGWARTVTPLTMHCALTAFDNLRVILERSPVQPVDGDLTMLSTNGLYRESYYLTVTIYEVL